MLYRPHRAGRGRAGPLTAARRAAPGPRRGGRRPAPRGGRGPRARAAGRTASPPPGLPDLAGPGL